MVEQIDGVVPPVVDVAGADVLVEPPEDVTVEITVDDATDVATDVVLLLTATLLAAPGRH